MEHARSLKALLVDVAPARGDAITRALAGAGWAVQAKAVAGAEGLAEALQDRGWDVVLHGAEGPVATPARKALALTRLTDPHLPVVAVSPHVRADDISAVVRGVDGALAIAADPEAVPEAVERALAAAALGRHVRVTHRLLLAQQAVTDHLAAGLAPEALFTRVLTTLGETLGWSFGAVWRPVEDAPQLHCAATWHAADAGAGVGAFAAVTRAWACAPGRGLPGRVFAFRRPLWLADAGREDAADRGAQGAAAGLTSAAAFPVALGEECLGILEFWSPGLREPDAGVAALFATVGAQIAQYLERWRAQDSEHRRTEALLRAERDRAQRYLDVAGTMIIVLDTAGRIELVNRAGCEVLQRSEAELLGADWIGLVIPKRDRESLRAALRAFMDAGEDGVKAYENPVVTSAGEERTIAWHLALVRDDEGRVAGVLSSGQDVTDRRRAEQQIAFLAYHDPLTGLPNRTLLEEHLLLALARSRRSGAGVALLHLDLDGFKLVNDSLGHASGDELLRDVARRLAAAVRATDLVARVSGDEFLVLVADIEGEACHAAERVAGQLVEALAEPFAIGGAEFQVTTSIGIATAPRDAREAEGLLSAADTAMYRAKQAARGGWAVYEADAEDPLQRLSLSARLRRALASGEFRLHYQPIVEAATGELVAVEALLRWEDPERGMIAPGTFIGVAEETGLIEHIGDWVVRAVCEQQVAWAAEGLRTRISFNVSPRQLRRLDFTERVARHIRETGADPRRLVAELTETATVQDPETAEPILEALHDLGLGIAIDDFGSGYSSLSRLRELPVETLKIDRAFLRDVPERHEAGAIVTAILALARALGRVAVAEGVETEAQRAFLAEHGCPLLQGYLLGRPMPPEDVAALLRAQSVSVAP